ncbi:hypothetical protein VPH35_036911 [Triticum aestivum]
MCKVCRSGRGSKSLDCLHSPSGLATSPSLSPSPLLLHLRRPPRPGRRGGVPPQFIHPPAPSITSTNTQRYHHLLPLAPPSPPAASATTTSRALQSISLLLLHLSSCPNSTAALLLFP